MPQPQLSVTNSTGRDCGENMHMKTSNFAELDFGENLYLKEPKLKLVF